MGFGKRHFWSVLVAAAVLTSACIPGEAPESPFAGETVPTAPPPPPTTTTTEPLLVPRGSVLSASNQIYLRSLAYDVHIPTVSPTEAAPVAILVHAAGAGGRSTMEPVADALATAGIVVYNIDIEVPGFGGRHPEPFSAVACALAIANRDAASHGGDPDNISLIGYSFGGLVTTVVALTADLFLTGCEVSVIPPFRVVGIAGTYDLDNLEGVATDALSNYFGGDRSQQPGSWQTADPRAYLNDSEPINMLVITASTDAEVPASIASDWVEDSLAAGHSVEGPVEIAGTHRSILANQQLIDALLDFLTSDDN